MSENLKQAEGVEWYDGVIANCRWGGARLCDVLQYVGAPESAKGKHVCFVSNSQNSPDHEQAFYGGSIPLEDAMNCDHDVLLAYEVRWLIQCYTFDTV